MKPIDALSIGWRTHLIFPRFDADVVLRPDHLLVRTPHNPTYWWGNHLLYDRPPRLGDAAAWLDAFAEGVGRRQSESRHVAIGVDSPAEFELPADFVAAGFECSAATVLTLRAEQLRPTPALPLPGFRLGALSGAAETAQAVASQVAADEGRCGPAVGYRIFRERQMQRYAAMERAGLGHWFGVFAATPGGGEQVVADCGLFRDGVGPGALGRFQHVSTHPSWRRKGLCRTLVHSVCRHGFEVMRLDTLVIVADPADVAIGLYESLGFVRGASTWCLAIRGTHRR